MDYIEEARAQRLPGLRHDSRLKVKHAQQMLRKTTGSPAFTCATAKLKGKPRQTTGKANRAAENEGAGCGCCLRGAAVGKQPAM